MKKLLTSLLCVMMIFCMMPTMAFAEGETIALPEAVDGVVNLVEDVDLPTAYVVNTELTVNLNGHSITVKNDTAGDGVFHVVENGKLTINGEGTINGVGCNNYNIAIWADGGNVIINGGTYTNVGAGNDDHYDLIYTKHGGTVEIYGGTFICQTPNWTLNQKDHQNGPEIAGGAITVYGGNFYQYNPSVSNSENPIANFVASGKIVTADEENNGYFTVREKVNAAITISEDLTFTVGEKKEFTITTAANDDAGENVYGIAALVDAAGEDAMDQLQSVEYYEVANGTWYDLNGTFGTAGTGFPLTDASSTFRAAFKTAGTYTVNYKIVKVSADDEVVAEGSAAVTVNPKQETPTPTPPSGGGGGYYPLPSVKPEVTPEVTPEEEAPAPEEKEALEPFGGFEKFKTRSVMTALNGKKAIKLTWNVPEGADCDGFEVFRSTKRYSGFGTKPFWTTTKTSYTNNKDLEEGKTYYYKVRAFKIVDGEKVYSDWSYKAWRTVE